MPPLDKVVATKGQSKQRKLYPELVDEFLDTFKGPDLTGLGKGNKFGNDQLAALLGRAGQAFGGRTLPGIVGGATADISERQISSRAIEGIISGKPISEINFSGLSPGRIREIVDMKKKAGLDKIANLSNFIGLLKSAKDLDLDIGEAQKQKILAETLNIEARTEAIPAGLQLARDRLDKEIASGGLDPESQEDALFIGLFNQGLDYAKTTIAGGSQDSTRTLLLEYFAGQNPEFLNRLRGIIDSIAAKPPSVDDDIDDLRKPRSAKQQIPRPPRPAERARRTGELGPQTTKLR